MLDGLVAERVEPEGVRLRAAQAADTVEREQLFGAVVIGDLDRLYRLAAVILGNRVEAEDAVHDAAETAWRHWAELREPARAEAWFQRILINTCRDRLRRRRRWRLREIVGAPIAGQHAAVADSTDDAARRDQLRRAFTRLSPDEQLIVVLRYVDDRTVPVIAELTGVAQGTVKSRLHNALRKLRAAIEEAGR